MGAYFLAGLSYRENGTQCDLQALRAWDDDENGFISCAEAERHGITPVHKDHPAYPCMYDADQDGIVCEPIPNSPQGASDSLTLELWDDNGNGFISCAEARRHGLAPVRRGHPAYPFMYDADQDGIVCEPIPNSPQGASDSLTLELWDDNGNGFISCAEARRHGLAPVRRGHPAYPFMYDADQDGIVCEPIPNSPQGASDSLTLELWDDNGNGFISCAEARRHGLAPVRRGHPAYPFMYDADQDGIVCEPIPNSY